MPARPRFTMATIMLTRRVNDREYRIPPTTRTNRIFGYVIAVLANHFKLELHALCVMANHYHLRFFDPLGNASDFARECHSTIAKLIIRVYGDDKELLWSPKPTNEVEPLSDGDAIAQISYILNNPVNAGIVRHGKNYPGLRAAWPSRPRSFNRPNSYFQTDSWFEGKTTKSGKPAVHWTETATLVFSRPRCCEGVPDHELAVRIHDVVSTDESSIHENRRQNGLSYMGRAAARRIVRTDRSARKVESRKTKPVVKCADPATRRARLSGIRAWREAYGDAMRRWPTDREVEFPHGTNAMVRIHKVNVAPAPAT